MAEVYDIHTDSMREMTGEDLFTLQDVYQAYVQVRGAVRAFGEPSWLVDELNEIHEQLKGRISARRNDGPA